VRGRTKHVLPPPHKTKLYRKVDLLLQSTQLIGMTFNKMALIYLFMFETIRSNECARQ
jgi:hypothetical protein